MKTITLLCLLAFTGCVTHSTNQKDISYADDGSVAREVVTKASVRTFFAGKQALADVKAQQTDGEQGFQVGALSQETEGGREITAALGHIQAIVEAVK